MTADQKPEDQITDASAVELNETQLDDAAGGIIAIAPATISPVSMFNPYEYKVDKSLPPR